MNDYLDIFSDVLRIATFQPRYPVRHHPARPSRAVPSGTLGVQLATGRQLRQRPR